MNIPYQFWSEAKVGQLNFDSVLIIDTMGELQNFYLSADLTFVGGSLVPIGGHDPAEPAALGKPVLFGPFMENAKQAATLLLRSGGAEMIENGNTLYESLSRAVNNRAGLAAKGNKCRDAILSVSGVSKKIAKILSGDVS